MLRAITINTLFILLLTTVFASSLYAVEWQQQMSIGGFIVSNISGSLNSDNSGNATGTLQMPDAGNPRISLTRSSRGEVTGNTTLNARFGGAEVKGSFTLTNSGLNGRGNINYSSRSIENASISFNSRNSGSGNGRIKLGKITADIDFSVSGGSFNFNGTTSTQSQEDTPLATYRFNGKLSLQGSGGRISGSANGRVERVGKLANQSTTSNVSSSVDMSNGHFTVNVGGVNVTFTLF